MVKYIIGAALAVGVVRMAFSLGAMGAAEAFTTGKFETYQLEDGGRVVAYFPSKATIPDAWSEEAKKTCIWHAFIE